MNLIVIGSSTGGPKALDEILAPLPPLDAAIIIVQHMPPVFDRSFVETLGRKIKMPVELAANGSYLDSGRVYFAPSRIHLRVVHNSRIELSGDEKVNFVCPSIDVTMKSLVRIHYGKLIGVVLTGMGADGAAGIAHIKGLGGVTIAQDERTSVVYGMPRVAFETGKVDFVLPKEDIGGKLLELVGELKGRKAHNEGAPSVRGHQAWKRETT